MDTYTIPVFALIRNSGRDAGSHFILKIPNLVRSCYFIQNLLNFVRLSHFKNT